MIPEETIEQIRLATDIVQIIGEFVRLKKRGKNYTALCPFHTEKAPSFSVSPDKQIYHCFGCGKGGNVFTFLMEHEKMTFIEAVRFLAGKANIEIKEDQRSDYKRELLDRISFANQVAVEYFRSVLFSTRYRNVLNRYLRQTRHIDDTTIKEFQLGMAGEEWDGLIRYAVKKDLTPEDLNNAGLVSYSEKTGNYVDRFRLRLMFPIFNLSSKPIAFGGRTLKKGESAKYVNSPETPVYVKGNVLYGLNHTKDHIRKAGTVYIVEGYFDLISLWRAGVKNVVASSGTAFTLPQARLLARFAEEVYLFFDADSAGQNAAVHSVDALYDAGLEVKVIVSPENEDPDSIARNFGIDKIEELKESAMDFIPYRIKDVNMKTTGIIGKEKLVKELAALGNKIHDATRRSLFFDEAAGILGIDRNLLQESVSKTSVAPSPEVRLKKKYNPVEVGMLSLLFNNPGPINGIFREISPDDFDSKELSRLYSAIINQYKTIGMIDAKKLIDNVQDDNFISLITEIACTDWETDQVESEIRKHVKLLLNEKKKRIRQRLQKELDEAEKEGDQEKAERILEELKNYGL